MLFSEYDKLIEGIKMNAVETIVSTTVRAGINSSLKNKTFTQDTWYKQFVENNASGGMSIEDAPKNKLLMVVTERFGTLYGSQNRGTFAMRGSVIVKLEDNLICCLDAYTYYFSGTNYSVHQIKGYHLLNTDSSYGKVQLLSNIKA